MPAETPREREEIAFGRFINWDSEGLLGTVFFGPGSHATFPSLPPTYVEELIRAGYLDPRSQHNDAPPAERLVNWAKNIQQDYIEHQLEVGVIGYMVSPYRSDSRIRLTGVSIISPGPIPDALKQEAGRRFEPDELQVDDFEIVLKWD